MRSFQRSVALVTLLCGACEDRPEPQPQVPPQGPPLTEGSLPDTARRDTAAPTTAPPARPESIRDTVLLEGTPTALDMRLVHSPAEFRTPFSTYVPADMHVRFEGAGDTAAVRFSAAFTGSAHPNAYMHVRLYPYSATRPQAQQIVYGFLRSRAPHADESQRVESPSWAEEAYTFRYNAAAGEPYVGRALIAQHGGRFFHVLIHYPAEFGDGLDPRLQYILDRWRWEATGEPLTEQR